MKLEDTDWAALIAYAFNEANPDQRERVNNLVATSPSVAATLRELTVLRETGERTETRFPAGVALRLVRAKLEMWEIVAGGAVSEQRQSGLGRLAGRALPVGGGSLGRGAGVERRAQLKNVVLGKGTLRGRNSSPQRWLMAAWAATSVCVGLLALFGPIKPHRSSIFAPQKTYMTAASQTAIVTLHNGARVTLAPRTALITRDEQITVLGEALFEVPHRTTHPMLVEIGDATVRVLGTAFSVRHYAGDRDVQVAVTEGRVEVVAPLSRSTVTLTAGRAAKLRDSTVTTQSMDSRSTYIDWTTHQIVFREASVTDVLAVLSRWYGYQFRLTDSTLATQQMSAAFSGRSIVGTLAMLKATLDVTMTFDDTVVTLRPRSHDASRARDTRYQVHDSFPISHEVGR